MAEAYPSALEFDLSQEDVVAVASALHENWRKTTRLQKDGTFKPRPKPTRDEAWIAAHGTNQVDIANTEFAELPEDWQAENRAAAEVVVAVIAETDGQADLSDEVQRDYVGSRIHDEWLFRNKWAHGTELDVHFALLTDEEQAKDLNQFIIGLEALQQPAEA